MEFLSFFSCHSWQLLQNAACLSTSISFERGDLSDSAASFVHRLIYGFTVIMIRLLTAASYHRENFPSGLGD